MGATSDRNRVYRQLASFLAFILSARRLGEYANAHGLQLVSAYIASGPAEWADDRHADRALSVSRKAGHLILPSTTCCGAGRTCKIVAGSVALALWEAQSGLSATFIGLIAAFSANAIRRASAR